MDLPDNINILSIEQWKGASLLVRLEHIFEKDEDAILSQPASVDLQDVLRDFAITSVREMTLDGNVAARDVTRLQWRKADEDEYGSGRKSTFSRESLNARSVFEFTHQMDLFDSSFHIFMICY